ncbi:hypothetical protein ACFCWY_08635 [Streptomyces sp. NPDC056362]|uniref:hypothetical protein n=1 Tax=unclassified Streptomyces TaxID=2593676 RepID=UPI0035DF0067
MSTSPSPQGRDWSAMTRADFDPSAPLAMVDAGAVKRPLAVPHRNGTDALFGDEPTSSRASRARRPAVGGPPQADALF